MSKIIDLTGQRFGRLTALSRAENSNDRRTRWICRCDCGNEVTVIGRNLRSGATKSCGCFKSEKCREVGKSNTDHGLSHSRLYAIWNGMVRRCHNPKAQRYNDYGGRGIEVCEEWRSDFMAFRAWALENGYREDLSIDRKDNDGNYCPENCRWATDAEQANNMSSNTLISFNGKTKNVKQWSEDTGISYTALISRFSRGWSVERALTTPSKTTKSQREG